MIIQKITIGYVVQQYDTKKKCFVSQEFIGSDDRNWESGIDTPCEPPTNDDGQEPYLNFDMVQPAETHGFKIDDIVEAMPDIDDDFTEFQGTIVSIRDNGNLITVKDQDDNCFDCRPGQLSHA